MIVSLFLGCIIGMIYARSLLYQSKSARAHFLFSLTSFLRVALLGVAIYFLLLSKAIHFILFIGSFLGTFWLCILKQKV